MDLYASNHVAIATIHNDNHKQQLPVPTPPSSVSTSHDNEIKPTSHEKHRAMSRRQASNLDSSTTLRTLTKSKQSKSVSLGLDDDLLNPGDAPVLFASPEVTLVLKGLSCVECEDWP